MSYMKWSDAFVTGIEIIDTQHQGLVDMLNQLAELLLHSHAIHQHDTQNLVSGLLKYVAEHFSTEEQLMEEYQIDPRHSLHHIHAHRDFAAKVGYALEQFDDSQGISGIELLQFLSNWLVFHILGEDRRLVREIKAIQSGLLPTLAFEQVQGNRAEISNNANDVLVNALVNLYSQLSEQHQLLIQQNTDIASANVELENYRQCLEQQIDEKTQALQKANQELKLALEKVQSASQAKSRFLGIISHELLTPINVILGFSSLLEHATIPEKQKTQAKKITQAGRELNGLLDEVLTYSRLDAGDLNIEAISFLPGALLSVVVDRFKTHAEEKALKIKVNVDPEITYLLGDEEHLRQAVEILLSNAIKYTDNGRIDLSASLLEKTADKVKLEFAVRDTGIGIPFERQQDLFQQFEQLNSSTTRRHKGIGLGLAICSRLVDLMDGELGFVSQPNQGSTFRIQVWLLIDQSKKTLVPEPNAQSDSTLLVNQNKQIESLLQLLAEGDMQARNLFMQVAASLHQKLGDAAYQQISKQIHDYQFDEAVVTLQDCGL